MIITYKVGTEYFFVEGTPTTEAEWAKYNADRTLVLDEETGAFVEPPPYVPTLDELKQIAKNAVWQEYQQLIQQGFQPQGKDFFLAIGETDQAQFTKGLALVNEGLALGQLTLQTPIEDIFKDKDGVFISVTVQEVKVMLFGYGIYVAQAQGAYDAKIAQIDACTTKEELEALA